jgi:hypothetical protein
MQKLRGGKIRKPRSRNYLYLGLQLESMSIDHPIAAVSIGKYRSAQVCERRS